MREKLIRVGVGSFIELGLVLELHSAIDWFGVYGDVHDQCHV